MITIAVYSNKGGTSKTSSTLNIAGVLAKEYQSKVLVIDADQQANLTQDFLRSKIDSKGSQDFLNYETTLEDLFYYPEKINDSIQPALFSLVEGTAPKKRGIDIIPVRPISIHPEVSLKAINKGLEDGYIKRGQIRDALSHIKRTRQHLYDYDFCLIDFAPANDELTREMLSASDYILVPTTLDNGSVNGIGGLMEIFGEVRKERNPELKILGIYPAVCNKQTSYDIQMTEGLKSSLGDIYLDCPIRYSTDVKWSTDFGVPLAFNRKSAPATEDYRRLVKELLKRMGGN